MIEKEEKKKRKKDRPLARNSPNLYRFIIFLKLAIKVSSVS